MPPTIYYTAVHAYGGIRIQDEAELHRWLIKLTDVMEAPIPNGWSTNEIPEFEITRRFKAIVGFEIEVERLEAKFKLGQDEPRKDALAVADNLEKSTNPSDLLLAEMVRQYNLPRTK